ncbi:hypothetical protein BJ912DRAFT_1033585 [Pholiota molesta]|nr:hypothetical protein BJ912DRAFT_1033585 [Pholiota molesta]
METSKEVISIDADGYAECPDCRTRIHCGSVGIANLEKRHRGSQTCRAAKAKRDKEGGSKKKTSTLLSFFGRSARPTATPSTLRPPAPVHNQKIPGPPPSVPKAVQMPATPPDIRTFVEKLHDLINDVPDHIPEASEYDALAIFAGNPQDMDNAELDADELWEEVLNGTMKSAFGWGAEENMEAIICRGRNGLDGLLNFVKYFVIKRGVSEGLFEGKLSRLTDALEKMTSTCETNVDACANHITPQPTEIIPVWANESDIHPESLIVQPVLSESDMEGEVVVLDSFPIDEALQKRKRPDTACKGYTIVFPDGQSPYTAYPFALHDTLSIPWVPHLMPTGTMLLFSKSCRKRTEEGCASCRPCQQLASNSTLEGILTRLNNGVHQNSTFAYHGISGLHEMLRRKNAQIEFYSLRSLNQARKLLGKMTALSDQKRLLMAISSGETQRVDRVISIGLHQRKGARAILASVLAAAQGHYHPKSFTEEEDMKALLIWKLSGNRVAEINHRATGAPSVSYLRTKSIVPPIVPSHAQPTIDQVRRNVNATLESIMDQIQAIRTGNVLHTVLMFDELATEKRIRWDPKSNHFLGVCRQHAHNTSMEFVNEGDMEELFRHIDDGGVHYAGEATIGALGILCKDNRIYPGRPVLVSGDCKRETGEEHTKVIQTTIDGVDSEKDHTKLRIVSLASDGETRRGSAFIRLTFKKQLSPESPLYVHLKNLPFLNLHVGDDDLTCDKDWKHVFKRFRNLFVRSRGVVVGGYRITPDIIVDHLKSEGASAEHVRALFDPSDQQDVKLAFDMLKDIWTLPRTPSTNSNPGFSAAREALWILGKLLYHMVFPYLGVDLSLSEQIEHLSAAAHLAIALYKLAGKDFIPTNLYIDLMIMIKNVLFCVAKAKVDDPDGELWIILLGTDRLEELFGILRTMVGNDANLDVLQLVSRLAGTTEISNILAKYPQWDRAPRRLKLPAMSRDSTAPLSSSVDHIKPASWRGNVKVKDVSLQTSWNRGRHLVEQECEFLRPVLADLAGNKDVDILAPSGTLLFEIPLADDDIDSSLTLDSHLDGTDIQPVNSNVARTDSDLDATETRIEVEDALGQLAANEISHTTHTQAVERTIVVDGKEVSKARILSNYSKYRKRVGSTDRLRRVQDIKRHIQNKTVSSNAPNAENLSMPTDDAILLSDPIATLILSENKIWLCIAEVNGLRIDGEPVPYLSLDMLSEQTVTVSYQVLGLRPANSDDDPEGVHDWRTYRIQEQSFTVPGHLVQPVNPLISNNHTLPQIPWYLFQGTVLVAMAASLHQHLTVTQLKSVPRLTPSPDFPYREASGE